MIKGFRLEFSSRGPSDRQPFRLVVRREIERVQRCASTKA